ncbi:MAG: cellulase family glycosylhydrolase [Blautia sp.]|nr:cellulase family glycosylhydrolase [Blautia sp.]
MQFLKTKGTCIWGEDGKEVLLTGYGIGNWMNQEGFLFGSSVFGTGFDSFSRAEGMDRGRSINQTIIETCGRSYADSFWKQFYRNYFGPKDIEHLAGLGMNSVRLPLKAAAFLREEEGICFDEEVFAILDALLDACEEHKIYAILDMHAAVAGQSAIGCDDGVDNQPHLYTDAEGWERTILLWEEFARRYKDRAVVAGYELLNEPLALPAHDHFLPDLVRFYDETIARIRAIDQKHIIFLQGHRFASRCDIFRPDMDPVSHNWVLTMHMYETLPDLGSLGPILAARDALQVPVWMGETGGSSRYMTVLYEMLRQQHIGVNIWCHKAVEGADAATLCTYALPEGMEKVCAYAQKGSAKPSYVESKAIFDTYLENIRFENCTLHEHRVDAILRRGNVDIPATGYDMFPGEGKSFQGSWPFCAFCGYRREDHMHLVYEDGFIPYESPAFAFAGGGRPPKYGDWNHLLLCLHEGDFVSYSIRELDSPEEMELELISKEGAVLEIAFRDEKHTIGIEPTEDQVTFSAALIPAGEDTRAYIRCLAGSVTIKTVSFRKCS